MTECTDCGVRVHVTHHPHDDDCPNRDGISEDCWCECLPVCPDCCRTCREQAA